MKVQITMSDDLVSKIDVYANKMSVSRSAFCSFVIGQYVMNLDKTYDVVDSMAKNVGLKGDKLPDQVKLDNALANVLGIDTSK